MGRLTEAFDYLNTDNPDIKNYQSLNITESLKLARKEYRKWLNTETPPIDFNVPWELNSISCDGGYSSSGDIMDFNIKDTKTGAIIIDKKYNGGTNNIAEFLGLVFSMIYVTEKERKDMVIYTDSVTALAWVRNKRMNSTYNYLNNSKINADVTFALEFLRSANLTEYKIEKWSTKIWGEILSDYGRK